MKPINRLIGFVLLALVTVEIGGWSLLGLLTSQDALTPFTWGQVLLVGIILQSGGFFLHLALGEENRASLGTLSTRIGAVLLAAALVRLAFGILRATRLTAS